MKTVSVVVIEDDFYIRKALLKYIRDIGDPYVIIGEADNGQTGLDLICAKQPDIALVDITMPIMDGITMIKNVRAEGLQTQIIILTGYSEFTHAQAAIQLGVKDYLLKPLKSSELQASLDKIQNCCLERSNQKVVFQKTLYSSLAEQLARFETISDDTHNLLEYLDYPVKSEGFFYVFSAQFNVVEGDKALFLSNISDWFVERFCENKIHSISFLADVLTMCFVLNSAEVIRKPVLENILQGVQQFLDAENPIAVKFAVSEEFQNIEMIHQAFTEVCSLQLLHMFHSSEPEIYFANEPGKDNYVIFPLEQQHKFKNLLNNGNINEITSFIHALFSFIDKNRCSTNSTYFFIAEMIAILGEYSIGHIPSLNDSLPVDLSVPSLLASKQVQMLEDYMVSLTLDTISSVRNDAVGHSKLIKRVQEYIERNYSNSGLRLSDISQECYVSLQYLCTVFRKETGVTIGDYLTDRRITQAKELLRSSNASLSEVAERCGYDDSGYFSKCFKKKTGYTPKQFANLR